MRNIKKFSLFLAVALVLTGSLFTGYQIAQAVVGEGTATIDGGAPGGNVTVVQSTSHKFTVVLTIGASGITANAENPTFTIPAGFTAPDATPVANVGLVVADGDWFAAGGATCVIDSPSVGLTAASGQVITVDVTSDCTVGAGGKITITYQGQSATTMSATALNIGVNDVISYAPVTPISAPPTITVTAGVVAPTLTITKIVINDNGGTAATSSFALFIDGLSVVSGVASTTSVGSHTVSETSNSGYTSVIGGNCAENGTVSLASGENKTCTITNNDIAPQLTVIKVVVNDNSGIKATSSFPLFIDNISVEHGVASTTLIGLHTVSETSDSGYTSVIGGNCAENGTITLALGEVKTCTITNDDIAASVTAPSTSSGGGGSRFIPPLIDLVKIPSPLALPAGPGLVKYTYTLRNIGTVPVTDMAMVGDTCSPIILVSGDANADAKLDVSETWVYSCSIMLSKTHTNIVTATGWANGISTTDIANATVVVGVPIVPPLIHIVKKPNVFVVPPGGAVTYMYTVTNPGTVPLNNVSVADDKCTGLPSRVVGHPGDINKNNLLESNESWSFTCQTNLAKTTVNTGMAEGSANGLTARDFAIATVVVATAVPGLPNTGFPPEGGTISWVITILIDIFAVLIFSYFAQRKQIA